MQITYLLLSKTVSELYSRGFSACLWLQTMACDHITAVIQQYYFSNRVVYVGNILPKLIVIADDTKNFKRRLEVYWKNQEVSNLWFGKELEVIVKCQFMSYNSTGYVKVLNEADKQA